MTEIQLGSGPSSSATHHITKTSRTLNRRYVVRPSNLAIEEAARTSTPAPAERNSAPSRLVNLRVHSNDLIRVNEQPAAPQPETASVAPVIPNVVEFGNNIEDSVVPAEAPLDLTQVVPPEDTTEPTTAIVFPENTEISAVSTQSYYDDNSTVTTTTIVATPVPETDTESLAMSIAADYAAASLGTAPTAPALEEMHTLENPNNSIDAIARVASEAIAAIRTATDPKEVAEQITSLKAFAEDIRSTSTTPEMLELSNTIETFINVAMKSDKIQEEVQKKLAADKAAESQVKVTATKKPTTPKPTGIAIKKPVASSRPAAKHIATKPATKPVARPTARRATKIARPQLVVDQDQALRKALRSVASMDGESEPHAKTAKKPQIKKKTSSKRFALAFFCAILCVSAIVYFVGTNIPDISVKVAAMQTGIEATYPSYVPRDFSLSDISSENGKITLSFKGPDRTSFTLTEEKSSWDSTTLLHNYVEPTWQNNYITTHEQGITLYISGASAAWVNGGVLYKIDAPSNSLTKKQLRNIVISM